jgi:hypothetical protein
MHFVLTGAYQRSPEAKSFLIKMKTRTPCKLVSEPESKSIRVVCDGHHIGYVPDNKFELFREKTLGYVEPTHDVYTVFQPSVYVEDN